MNWIINTFLILFIPHLIMRIAQIFKCNSNGKNCDSCSWLDICYDINEHSQLLKLIPSTSFCEKGDSK